MVNLIEYGAAKPTSVVLRMAFECTITVYLVPFESDVVGVIINVLPETDSLKGLATPVEVFKFNPRITSQFDCFIKCDFNYLI